MTSTAAQPEPTDELPAPDQTERVILRAAQEHGEIGCPCDMLVIGDTTGVLTAEALELVADHPGARVLSWTSSRAETDALAALLPGPLEAGRLVLPTGVEPAPLEEFAAGAEAHLALARLPKSLAALEDLARRLAVVAERSGRDDLTLVAGGRVKHMTHSQNDTLAAVFSEVRGSRGLGKSRALVASGPRADVDAAPARTAAVIAQEAMCVRRVIGPTPFGETLGL